MLIEKTVDEFLSKTSYYHGYQKTTVKNLMNGRHDYSLLNVYEGFDLIADELSSSIKTSVTQYTSYKDSAINIYKKYIDSLKNKYNFYVEIIFQFGLNYQNMQETEYCM